MQVAITFFTTSYGSDLSASTVISRDASAVVGGRRRSATIGRSSTARSGSITCVAGSRISAMLATSSPCTNSWSFVIITTTDWFGCASAVDCGISTPLVFWTTSTSVE